MARLCIDNELFGGIDHKMAFKYLKREHNAYISKPVVKPNCRIYYIDGDGLPKGDQWMGVISQWIAEGVVMISIS